MGEKIVANVFVYFDDQEFESDPNKSTNQLYSKILDIKENNRERYAKLHMKTYPMTERGKILVGKKPVKYASTLKAGIDLSDFSSVHYLMGMDRQEIPIAPTEVDIGHGQTGIVTKVVGPYHPSIHAHLDEGVDKTLPRGMILEFDFSKSKMEKFKGLFYRAKK
jgi:hypothetical protein